MCPSPLFSLENVAKIYGSRLLFKNVSLQFGPGDSALLLGANGAGKSTLLRIIAGLCRPDSGTVQRKQDLRLGYLGHAPFLYPGLSARENLTFWNGLHASGKAGAKVDDFLELVGLAQYADEPVRVFSRGMNQRLNLARALMTDPELLLLDEPFSGLDLASKNLLVSELQRKSANGCALLLISHDPNQDSILATRKFLLENRTLKIFHAAQAMEA